MASFLNKINRMRNVRMHATNQYHIPHPGLYHEIIQGIPWSGGISLTKPKRLDAVVDRVIQYVLTKRPEYKNYPWCSSDNKGVYTHPANFASDRICHLMDLSSDLTLPEAFEIVDKEMKEKKAEVDLQVTLAREHAARLGVVNQGVESLLKRANRVYESVFKMKEEQAVRTRRSVLSDVCRQVAQQGHRLDMQDIIDLVPYRDEQIQFFLDFPEYRKLFPPLWWLSNEVANVQAAETEQQLRDAVNEAGGLEQEAEGAGKEEEKTGKEEEGDKKKMIGEDLNFLEEDPNGDAFVEWPPQAMFDRQARNRVKMEEMYTSGVDPDDAELERARLEARSIIEQRSPNLDARTKETKIEQLAQKMKGEGDLFDQLIKDRERQEKRKDRAGILEEEKPDFYKEYRKFLVANHHLPAKERGQFLYGEEPMEVPLNEGDIPEEQQKVIDYLTKRNYKLDLDDMRTLRESIHRSSGDIAAMKVFEYAEGGGAATLAQLEGLSPYDPLEPRHVNLTSNLDLSPFYPENAFPPRGILADPNVDLRYPDYIPEKYEKQYQQLKEYGNKYAHAIEDYAPKKSLDYIEETVKKNLPFVMEYTADKPKLDAAQRAENLADVIEKQNTKDFKSLDEYESKLSLGEENLENITKEGDKVKDSAINMITSEAELQAMKKAALDELAKIAFESDAERKEYEQMLERRFDYITAKRRERNHEWSQYWPADKPETLIYRGPEVIREIFPEAYKLAVTRKFEELSGVPLKAATEIKSYVGLWKSVRAREQRLSGEERSREVKDLSMIDWQHTVSLDPSVYKR